MTRVLIVADSGPAFAHLTTAVGTLDGAYIVRHASGRSSLERLVAATAPDLVVIGDLGVAAHALARLAEVRRGAPAANVVVLSSSPDAAWLADALRAEAAAVVPGDLDAKTLGIVLREVVAEQRGTSARPSVPAVDRLARRESPRRRRRRRRARGITSAQEETAA